MCYELPFPSSPVFQFNDEKNVLLRMIPTRSFWQAACENLVGVKMGAIEEWEVADPQVVMEWSALCIAMHCHAITPSPRANCRSFLRACSTLQ